MAISKKQGRDIARLINQLEVATMLISDGLQQNDIKKIDLFVNSYNEAAAQLRALNINVNDRG